MECPRCGTWSCFWCGQVIPRTVGYKHFWRKQGPCPPDRCPLWVVTQEFNRIQVAETEERMRDLIPKAPPPADSVSSDDH
jgi:hypothetical protein